MWRADSWVGMHLSLMMPNDSLYTNLLIRWAAGKGISVALANSSHAAVKASATLTILLHHFSYLPSPDG
jgi:hypothetical protein